MLMKEESNKALEAIAELLDIPPSYYEKAAERYRSLGKWLHRKESKVVALDPEVYLQGSFRYGTVIRPLLKGEEYDLDLVAHVQLGKGGVTQEQLKHLIGDEVQAYAEANGIHAPVVERHRCWRLDYDDDVSFHMDILPCVPEDADIIREICGRNVPAHLAAESVAITDDRHPEYRQRTRRWPCSNPRGLGDWFEDRAKPMALERASMLVDGKVYASIDQVPSYEWKTPLQRAIQILKRHRDVMYMDNPTYAPISMIITVLAARIYQGESNVYEALHKIVDRMPQHVGTARPRIPNPVNPAEDFADHWAGSRKYEDNFWAWHSEAKGFVDNLPAMLRGGNVAAEIRSRFKVVFSGEQIRSIRPASASAGSSVPAPAVPYVHIEPASAPRPWRRDV